VIEDLTTDLTAIRQKKTHREIPTIRREK